MCQALMCMPDPASLGPRQLSESGQQVSKDGSCTSCSLTFVKPLKIFLIKKIFFHDIEMRSDYILKSSATACWLRKVYFMKCVASVWQPYSQLRKPSLTHRSLTPDSLMYKASPLVLSAPHASAVRFRETPGKHTVRILLIPPCKKMIICMRKY